MTWGFVFQLQKSKEREERLEEVIQAYEKIHLEKSNVQRDLDKMVGFRLVPAVMASSIVRFPLTVFSIFVRRRWRSSTWRGSAVWSRL